MNMISRLNCREAPPGEVNAKLFHRGPTAWDRVCGVLSRTSAVQQHHPVVLSSSVMSSRSQAKRPWTGLGVMGRLENKHKEALDTELGRAVWHVRLALICPYPTACRVDTEGPESGFSTWAEVLGAAKLRELGAGLLGGWFHSLSFPLKPLDVY